MLVRMSKMLIGIAILYSVSAASFAHANEQVDVYIPNFPPFHILDGAYKNKGVLDYIAQQVSEQHQGNFTFRMREANFARLFNDAKKGRKICSFALRKTAAREEFMDYSMPHAISMGNGLVVGPHNAALVKALLDENGEVDLALFQQQNQFTYWAEAARSYEAAIEDIVKNKSLIDAGVVQIYSSKEALSGVLRNLTRPTQIAHFAYAEEVSYHSAIAQIAEGLSYFRVKDDSEDYSAAHFACTKGAWNKEVLEAVNKVIIKLRVSEGVKQVHMQWLPKNIHEQYRQMVDRAFGASAD